MQRAHPRLALAELEEAAELTEKRDHDDLELEVREASLCVGLVL